MNPDGTIRQFYFSADELRDIATAMIGKEQTVPAFGFAFYSPKERRTFALSSYYGHFLPEIKWITTSSHSTYTNLGVLGSSIPAGSVGVTGAQGVSGTDFLYLSASNSGDVGIGTIMPNSVSFTSSVQESATCGKVMSRCFSSRMADMAITGSTKVKSVSIGAGAKVRQELEPDPYTLDSWKDVPDAVMTIYFVFQEQFEQIKAKGMRDLNGVAEGMLAGLPVG